MKTNPFDRIKKEGLSRTRKTQIRKDLVQFMAQHPVTESATHTPSMFAQLLMLTQKPMTAALIAVVVLLSAGGGVTYASQDALPNDFLYPVKTASEEVRVFIEPDLEDKAALELKYAQRRREELEALISQEEITPELAKKTKAGLDEAIASVETIRDDIYSQDREAAVRLALRADEFEDAFIDALQTVPQEHRDDLLDVLQDAIDHARDNNSEMLALMGDALAQNPTDDSLGFAMEKEITEEAREAKEHVRMLTQAIAFGKQHAKADTRSFLAELEAQVAKITAAITRVEAELNKPSVNLDAVFAVIDDPSLPDIHELMDRMEAHFGEGTAYEELEYDGPWIESDMYDDRYGEDENHEGENFVDPWAIEGECHSLYEDENTVECYEDGSWNRYDKAEFEQSILPVGEYRYNEGGDDDDAPRFDFPEYPEDYDFEKDDPYYYGEHQVDEEFEALKAQYDKDGDGEVDCIGEKDCPGPDDPIWDAFDRPCDELCEQWHEQRDRMLEEGGYPIDDDYEGDYYDEEDGYDGPDEQDRRRHDDEFGEYDPNHDKAYDDYDPEHDPYSEDEYDHPHDEDGNPVDENGNPLAE